VAVGGQTTTFVYDGDGNLVKKIKPDGSKTLYPSTSLRAGVGGIYEVDKAAGGAVTRTVTYYPVAGAMRINSTLYYVLKDHLGSASVVTDASGTILGENRYFPFGETRVATGTILTDKLFTGQREMAGLGIYHFNARFYSPKLGRFLSADTIVPSYANPQSLNRFSYVTNNPLRYIDPTGHRACGDGEAVDCDGRRDRRVGWLRPEREFIRRARSPLREEDGPVNYSGFGGCNTITGSCSNGHHPALDSRNNWDTGEIVNWWGRPIYATEPGVVIRVGSSDWGNYVMVEHDISGERFYSIYAHLQAATVEAGAEVDNNTQIGEMGGTSESGNIDPHLHFEVRESVNVDLSQANPFQGEVWWPQTLDELNINFVNLGATTFADYDSNYFASP